MTGRAVRGHVMDWGPLPNLVNRLAAVLPPVAGGVTAATRPYGGPWGALTHQQWSPMTVPLPRVRPRGLFARWFRGPIEDPILDPTTRDLLTREFARCHAWLELNNQRFLRPLLGPEVVVIPPRLTAVSRVGLGWAVQAYEAAVGSRSPAPEAPAGTPRTGDLLALHLLIEGLVRSGVGRFPGPAEGTPRFTGGLRDPQFLRAYPALSARSHRLAAVVDGLLPHSPLTNLVYPDLLGIVPERGNCAALWRRPAKPPEPTEPEERPGDAPEEVDPADESLAIVAWLSQLARSLVAAILSPAPSWEASQEAHRDVQRLLLAKPQLGWFARLMGHHPTEEELGAAVRAAEARAKALEAECRQERVARFAVLAGILRGPDDDLCSRALHYRTLDMLIRHTVTAATAGIYADWRAARAGPLEAEPYQVLCAPDGAAIKAFAESLFGRPLTEVPWSELGSEVRDAIRFLLDPLRITPDDPAPAENAPAGGTRAPAPARDVAAQLGVLERAVKQLAYRFEGANAGLQLPIPPEYAAGSPPPSVVLAEWYVAFVNRFPAPAPPPASGSA